MSQVQSLVPTVVEAASDLHIGMFLQNQGGEVGRWSPAFGPASGRVAAQVTAASPAGTTSATAVMGGLAGSITPAFSTQVEITITGVVKNGTISDGATLDARIGTGAAPANGAAVAGTLVGIAQTFVEAVAAQTVGFVLHGFATVVPGTSYWFDFSQLAVTGGTVTVTGVTATALEI